MKAAVLTNSSEPRTGPAISIQSVCLVSIFFNVLYILPFYLSPTTRPSPTLTRDAPAVIRARIRAVTIGSVISTLITVLLVFEYGDKDWRSVAKLLGWWPISLYDVFRTLLLVAILFAGPLFEAGIVESGWEEWIRGQSALETLRSWQGWRNLVVGPFTEELIWRSLIIPLHLLACPVYPTNLNASAFSQSQSYASAATTSDATSALAREYTRTVILVTPLYFGIAHVHHFYEFRLTHPRASMVVSIVRTLFQFTYTTVFGWFEAYVFVRTGSLAAVILAHSFCNWLGLPRFWGRVGQDVYLQTVRAVADQNPAQTHSSSSLGASAVKGSDEDEDEDKERSRGLGHAQTSGTHDGGFVLEKTTVLPMGQQRGLGIAWTVTYYVLLVAGAVGFYTLLGPLTDSKNRLAEF